MGINTTPNVSAIGETGDQASGSVLLVEGSGMTITRSGQSITLAASGSGDATKKTFTQTAHGLSVGNAVELDGSGNWIKADSSDVTKLAIGIVSTVADANTVEVTFSGFISGLSGLTTGEYHYTSAATPGLLTATEPASPNYSNPILLALSTTTGVVLPYRPSTPVQASSYAPVSSQYVTLATDGTLTNERVLTAGSGITVTDAGAGSTVTVAVGGARKETRTTVADIAYSVVSTDRLIVYTSLTAARTVSLEAATTAGAGRTITIVDESGHAGDFPITIDPSGTEKIDGVLTTVILDDFGSITLHCDGSNWFSDVKTNPVQVQNRDFTQTTVSNTVVETTVYSYTLQANTLRKSRGLRWKMMGHALNNAGASRTMQFKFKFGSQNAYDVTHTFGTPSALERPTDFNVYIQGTAATNTQESTSSSTTSGTGVSGTGTAVVEHFLAHHHTLAQDTTADIAMSITVTFSSATATIQYLAHTVILEIV